MFAWYFGLTFSAGAVGITVNICQILAWIGQKEILVAKIFVFTVFSDGSYGAAFDTGTAFSFP